jgi:hypothetical protein
MNATSHEHWHLFWRLVMIVLAGILAVVAMSTPLHGAPT